MITIMRVLATAFAVAALMAVLTVWASAADTRVARVGTVYLCPPPPPVAFVPLMWSWQRYNPYRKPKAGVTGVGF